MTAHAAADPIAHVQKLFQNHHFPISASQVQLLVEARGLDPLRRIYALPAEEASPQLRQLHYVARVTERLCSKGMTVTWDEAERLRETLGERLLSERLNEAFLHHVPTAVKALDLAIRKIRAGEDPTAAPADSAASGPAAAPASPSRAPIHATTLRPPVATAVSTTSRDQAPVPVASTRSPQPPPPRAPERHPAAEPAPRGNVRQLADGPRQERHPQEIDCGPASDASFAQEPTDRRHAPPADQPTGAAGQDREYDQHSCYGKDIAVTFECSWNRERTAKTVNIKAAKAKGASCKQGVDWKNGIMICLEPHEVQTLLAVMAGFGETARFAGHGHDNLKWVELSENTGKFAGALRLTIAHGQDRRSVNIGATDIGEVMALFDRAARSQLKSVSEAFFPILLRRVYDLYLKNAERRAEQSGGARRAS